MRNNKGFSLVELIVVIAIMAILAAVAIPTFAVFINRANEGSDESFANDIEYAVELALAAEDEGVTAIAATYDKSDKKIVTLTYTTSEGTFKVIDAGAKATGDGAADSEICDMIIGVIDAKYAPKTAGPIKSVSEIVTITVQE